MPLGFEVPEGSTLVAVQFEGDEDITYVPQPGDEDLVVSPVTKCFLLTDSMAKIDFVNGFETA